MRVITRQEMIKKANTHSQLFDDVYGDFIDISGSDWLTCNSKDDFKVYIESKGFKVINIVSTSRCTAVAVTDEGYEFAFNGYCRKEVNK